MITRLPSGLGYFTIVLSPAGLPGDRHHPPGKTGGNYR